MDSCWGLFGLWYVLVKLLTKASSKSSQQSILPALKLLSQIRAGPSSIYDMYLTAYLRLPPAMFTAVT